MTGSVFGRCIWPRMRSSESLRQQAEERRDSGAAQETEPWPHPAAPSANPPALEASSLAPHSGTAGCGFKQAHLKVETDLDLMLWFAMRSDGSRAQGEGV